MKLGKVVETLAKEPKEKYEENFSGWKQYLEDYVGYGQEDLSKAGKIMLKELKLSEDIFEEPSEIIFISRSLFSYIAKTTLIDNLDKGFSYNIAQLEDSKTYKKLGIENFPSFCVFSWYVKAAEDSKKALRKLKDKISEKLKKKEVVDFLTQSYFDLFSGDIRHALGEFFTPIWLAERIIKRADITKLKDKPKVLDPSCGSGSFLAASFEVLPEGQGVDFYLESIHGYELNPISVITATVAYTSKISDKISEDSPVHVPIFQVDSTALPSQKNKGKLMETKWSLKLGQVKIEINSDGSIPSKETEKLSKINNQFKRELVENQLRDTAKAIKKKPYSLVVGNPAWINWENLSTNLRERLKVKMERYGLLKGKKSIGALKIDSACLALYSAADHLLSENGRLAFAITESVVKANSMKGFRDFSLPSGEGLKVIEMHDLTELQLFEEASNRTGIIVLEKGKDITFPIPYLRWSKTGENIPEDLVQKKEYARPIGLEKNGPWVAASKKILKILSKVAEGQDHYQARLGVNTGGASGLFWVKLKNKENSRLLVSNENSAGRKDYPDMGSFRIETDCVYPLVHGRHVSKWSVKIPDRYILVPHTQDTGMQPLNKKHLNEKYPSLSQYLHQDKVKNFLKNRRALKRRWGGSIDQDNWYTLFEIGEYTFKPYKVLFRGQVASDMVSAVGNQVSLDKIGEKMVMPNQTVHFIPLDSKKEAHFISAILNSSIVTLLYRKYGYKHPSTYFIKMLSIPKFTPNSEEHRRLAELSQKAHEKGKATEELQESIDFLSGKVMGLDKEEVEGVRNCLN